MRTIFIGDIHGRKHWEGIVEKERDANIVFVGDYFDSKSVVWRDQLTNFENILAFKESHPHNVTLLIGNHDIHYFPFMDDRSTAGFQKGAAYIQLSDAVNYAKHHLQMAHQVDNIISTHAGVSHLWLNNMEWANEPIVDFINDIWRYTPLRFEFDSNGLNIGSGDEPHQSPVWIRPKSLMRINKFSSIKKDYIQVVGHTHRKRIDIKGSSTGGRYYFIDTLGRSGEYLIYDEGKFSVDRVDPYKKLYLNLRS